MSPCKEEEFSIDMLELVILAVTCGVYELAPTQECGECEAKRCIEHRSGLVFLALGYVRGSIQACWLLTLALGRPNHHLHV